MSTNEQQDRNAIPELEDRNTVSDLEGVHTTDNPGRNTIPGSPEQRDPGSNGVTSAADVSTADGSSEVSDKNVENSSGEVSAENGEKSEAGDSTEDSVKPAPDTFPRDYVEKLRRESAGYRERAKRVDELERRLHAALVKADGRLADPADLEFNVEHLDDPEALEAAITGLVERKPGLRARQYRGDVGAGKRGGSNVKPVDLIELMRGN